MDKKDKLLKSHAPKKEQIEIQDTASFPDLKQPFPGDSVDGHEDLETSNEIIARDEIKQQNDNL